MASMETVIQVENVSRWFGHKQALDNVSLSVQKGRVFGLVGENGAGKTTLIKHLLGSLVPKTGGVHVFGVDPAYDPPAVLSRIGYLSEDRDLPGWMRVGELMRYTQAFFPDWDQDYAEQWRQRLELPIDAKLRTLSRGEKAKAGLLAALAHRPELLLLDEPSSGLDPVARRAILEAVVRSVAEEGRTVFFSSHLLDEIERVADDVVMLHHGRAILDMTMEELKSSHHRFIIRFEDAQAEFPLVPGVLHAEGESREWAVVCQGEKEILEQAFRNAAGQITEYSEPSLDTIFVAHIQNNKSPLLKP